MTTHQQMQQHDTPQLPKQRIKHIPWIRLGVAFIAFVVVFVIGYLFVLGLLNIQVSIILAFISIIIGLFQWLFPISTSRHEPSITHTHAPLSPQHSPAPPAVQPIIVQVPTTQPLPPPSPSSSHRGILGLPPPTDPRTIQQREHLVKDVYARLTQPGITAIALTGIGGVGKSTLAALLYRYAEEQRHTHSSPFLAETIWLTIDPAVTFADLAGNLFEALGKPLPDLSSLAPQNQAVALFNALNTTDKPRLIILDQFENLLDWDAGHALTDRPGVGEWLDTINNQQCACCILLTSRPRPVGTREYPPTYSREYPVGGLEVNEGIALLRSQGVQGIERDLQSAVSHCAGHALSLTLLATLIRDHHLDLPTFFKSFALWSGDIATNLLDQIFTQKLHDAQRELLLAFSVYREPVPVEAASAIVTSTSKTQMPPALKALVTQHLVEAVGEGRYQLHAIIQEYAQRHFNESSERANEESLRVAHARAAQYYLEQASKNCPTREKRRGISDVDDLIEAIWQYSQAGMWQEAYDLMEREALFDDLHRWGSNAFLLELYQLLETDQWDSKPSETARICHNLGWAYIDLGQLNQGQKYLEKALMLCTKSGDKEEQGAVLNSLGVVYRDLGQKERGQKCLEQALNISRESSNPEVESKALTNLAIVYSDLGQKEPARMYCEQALKICRELGDLRGEGWALNILGATYADLGQKEQGRDYLVQSLRIRGEARNRLGEGRTLNNLGRVYLMLERKEQALDCSEEALHISREIGDYLGEGKARSNLGLIYAALEKRELAQDYYEQALHILREVGERRAEGRAFHNLGQLYIELRQKKQALESCQKALLIFREIGDRWGEGETVYNVGALYFLQGRDDVALACFLYARAIFDELHNPLLTETQNWIEAIHKELGDEQFPVLLSTVEPQAQQIVDQALREGLE